ncbi:7-cyano-7-deazaguanine synthase QueC [Ferrovum sp.]|uniref:7-cyano-7-deazaguanine synthase QueC n=1 Tax=Ferrovum sp. TaxID=2609467 RepID=UPI002622BC2A|nr:7-cyano-7-deazaguanine synthase QueC [Ferrovum sp.]
MAGRNAVILLSGGLDSATVLAMAHQQGFGVYAMSFAYGQRHAHELDCARRLALQPGVIDHSVVNIDLRAIGGSALTTTQEVPKDRDLDQAQTIPVTYVPARNTIFLSFALAWAEVLGVSDLFIGVNALDYSGYPDCRPEYLNAFERMANLATRRAVEGAPLTLHAPLLNLTKADIIRRGLALGVDYGLTTSCYDPGSEGRPCGHCDACLLRARGFAQVGVPDPLGVRYAGTTA